MTKQSFEHTERQLDAIQLLISPANHILLYGGARSGKTLLLLRSVLIRAAKARSRHLILRQHFNSAKTSIWLETWPKLKAIWCPDLPVRENKTDYYLQLSNGSEIWVSGLDSKERTDKLLGKEYSTLYFNECSEMAYDSVQTALTRLAESSGLALKAYYDENPPMKKHWTYTMFIGKKNPDTNAELKHPGQYAALQLNPTDNRRNLPANYIEDVLGNLSERKRLRFLAGEFADDVAGALWHSDLINAYRVTASEVPELTRIVVGVDPAVTDKITSDETGIVAVGRGANGHLYVLDDRSLLASPLQWGQAVVASYKLHAADRVIGETNNGGDLVEMNLRNIDASISYKSVHATRGKAKRAEPVAAYYERGMVHHAGEFPALEDEMCSYNPDVENQASPNRMDALVWACTELGVMEIDPHVYSGGGSAELPIEAKADNYIMSLVEEIRNDPSLPEAEKLAALARVEREL